MGQTKLIYSMLFFDFLTRSPSFSIFQKQMVWVNAHISARPSGALLHLLKLLIKCGII